MILFLSWAPFRAQADLLRVDELICTKVCARAWVVGARFCTVVRVCVRVSGLCHADRLLSCAVLSLPADWPLTV